MWSLNEKKGDKEYPLAPLMFSNGKSQEDVVQETIKAINEGNKIIFIHGVCGTGKSAIALNLAKEIGKASVVVPVKALQKQYEQDYMHKKYLLKKNGEKLKIKVITGRQNHICPFLCDGQVISPEEIRDLAKKTNRRLSDFHSRRLNIEQKENLTCDNPWLPCKIEIKEKNAKIIYNYLKKIPNFDINYFAEINKVSRRLLAPLCPYWSPIMPTEIDFNLEARKNVYDGLSGKKYRIYQRQKGCGYYDQFQDYLNSDVIIFNSEKYKIETLMDRKPATEIEIIDECDEFLDNLSNFKKINLNKLYLSLGSLFSDHDETNKSIHELIQISKKVMNDEKVEEYAASEKILKLSETPVLELLNIFLDSELLSFVEIDEENYCFHVDEVARTFRELFNEAYISFYREENDLIARIVTINLEKRFAEFKEKNKILVLMSGTIHSENVLKNVFGIKDYKIINAETSMPGKIIPLRTGMEVSCSYENFKTGRLTRKQYLLSLAECIKQAPRPTLVHVTAFNDLPNENESKFYNFPQEITTQEKLYMRQKEDKLGKDVQEFKDGKSNILYSTKCNRGADFPGNMCNSIILTRFPYPNVSSIFWQILKKTKPEYYNELYADKSKREFLQRIYRALRSKDDKVHLLSPDSRVFTQRLF
jgi:Rad3-related DNA helicase